MVHAVLDHHAPGVRVVDVTHHIAPHDVRAGALTLWRAAPWLVPGVILAVVDPGVGTDRRAVAIEVADSGAILIGPDNGLLLPAALHLGPISAAVELDRPPDAPPPGATFAGRDLFAPAAARAARGVPLRQLGTPIDAAGLAGEALQEAIVPGDDGDGDFETEVLWIDRFGNTQLNLAASAAGPGPFHVGTGGGSTQVARVVASYGAIAPDPVALVVDSYGMLSLCCPGASAADRLELRLGDFVFLRQAGPER